MVDVFCSKTLIVKWLRRTDDLYVQAVIEEDVPVIYSRGQQAVYTTKAITAVASAVDDTMRIGG